MPTLVYELRIARAFISFPTFVILIQLSFARVHSHYVLSIPCTAHTYTQRRARGPIQKYHQLFVKTFNIAKTLMGGFVMRSMHWIYSFILRRFVVCCCWYLLSCQCSCYFFSFSLVIFLFVYREMHTTIFRQRNTQQLVRICDSFMRFSIVPNNTQTDTVLAETLNKTKIKGVWFLFLFLWLFTSLSKNYAYTKHRAHTHTHCWCCCILAPHHDCHGCYTIYC